MKVKTLITKLQKCNPNAEVILSADNEGNSFSHLYNICSGDDYFIEEDGEIQVLETEDLEEYPKAKECVVLWP